MSKTMHSAIGIIILLLIAGGGVWVVGRGEGTEPTDDNNDTVLSVDTSATADTAWLEDIPFRGELSIPDIDPRDWQIYQNEEYRFEMKYPPKPWYVKEFGKHGVAFSSISYDFPFVMHISPGLFHERVISEVGEDTERLERFTFSDVTLVKETSFDSDVSSNKFCSFIFERNGIVYTIRSFEDDDVTFTMLNTLRFF